MLSDKQTGAIAKMSNAGGLLDAKALGTPRR